MRITIGNFVTESSVQTEEADGKMSIAKLRFAKFLSSLFSHPSEQHKSSVKAPIHLVTALY